MGTRVYTYDQLLEMPNPPHPGIAAWPDLEYRGLSDAQMTWGRQLAGAVLASESAIGRVLRVSEVAHLPNHVAVFITPDLDVGDPEQFPDEVDGWPVVYIRVPPAQPQGQQNP